MRPQLLAARDEQGLANSFRLALGPTFGPTLGPTLGLAFAENALVNRRLLDPTNPEQHGGYPFDDRVDLLFLVAQTHQNPGCVPQGRRLLGAGFLSQPLGDGHQDPGHLLRHDVADRCQRQDGQAAAQHGLYRLTPDSHHIIPKPVVDFSIIIPLLKPAGQLRPVCRRPEQDQ